LEYPTEIFHFDCHQLDAWFAIKEEVDIIKIIKAFLKKP